MRARRSASIRSRWLGCSASLFEAGEFLRRESSGERGGGCGGALGDACDDGCDRRCDGVIFDDGLGGGFLGWGAWWLGDVELFCEGDAFLAFGGGGLFAVGGVAGRGAGFFADDQAAGISGVKFDVCVVAVDFVRQCDLAEVADEARLQRLHLVAVCISNGRALGTTELVFVFHVGVGEAAGVGSVFVLVF